MENLNITKYNLKGAKGIVCVMREVVIPQFATILITGTPNYHHCLLSSNLGTILLGRKECDIMYTYTYWIILISTLIPTPNVPVYKF